jgi:hypothetical protein
LSNVDVVLLLDTINGAATGSVTGGGVTVTIVIGVLLLVFVAVDDDDVFVGVKIDPIVDGDVSFVVNTRYPFTTVDCSLSQSTQIS